MFFCQDFFKKLFYFPTKYDIMNKIIGMSYFKWKELYLVI